MMTGKHKKMALCGVKGDMLFSARDGELFDRQQWISEWRPAPRGQGYGPKAIIQAEVRFDDGCRNGHNTFAITGTVSTAERNARGLDNIAGGCLHDDIAKAFPELAHLIRWHLVSSDGPMHYVANTLYLAGDRDHFGRAAGEPSRFATGVRFAGVPIVYPLKDNLAKWLESLADYDRAGLEAALVPIAVAYDPRAGETRHDFAPKWQFAGQPPLKWYECPFDSEGEAERFAAAWLDFAPEVVRVPVAFSDGKARDLDAARRVAIWPEATDEQLSAPRDELKTVLEARLPTLMDAFKADIIAAGFDWHPAQAELQESE